MTDLASKKALITGGGGGIAEAIALRLEALGYGIILTDISREKAEMVSRKLKHPAEIIVCDQTNEKQVETLIKTVSEKHANLAVLVNNAGYIKTGPFLHQPGGEIERHAQINLLSPLRLIHGIAPLMIKNKSGAIVTIVSVGGIISLADSALYSATKFGLRGFLAAFHDELKGTGVKISGVYPTAVDTPMLMHEALNGGSALNWVNSVRTPDEVARAVVRAIKTGRMEIYVPYFDALTTRLAVFFPWFPAKIMPLLKWLGERGRLKWLKKKGINQK